MGIQIVKIRKIAFICNQLMDIHLIQQRLSLQNMEVFISECEYVFWFKLSRNLSNSSSDILFGVTYVPPENTRYSSSDCFTDIEQEMLNMLKTTQNICLLGDFNARTGKL